MLNLQDWHCAPGLAREITFAVNSVFRCLSFKQTNKYYAIKVINVGSDTFGKPIFQKGLQN